MITFFGLHLGESLQVAALDVVGGLVQSSRTIGEALTQAGAFVPLLTDLLTMAVSHVDQTFTIRFVPNARRQQESPDVCRQQVDFFMAFLLHEVDGLVLRRMEPRAVYYPAPGDQTMELTRVLRGPVSRQGNEYALIFDDPIWHEPILTGNYAVQELLLKQTRSAVEGLFEQQFLARAGGAVSTNERVLRHSLA
ncbi:AraC family transcriptional regulator ligand-binding domain-containing protein [Spirosoma arcticum]